MLPTTKLLALLQGCRTSLVVGRLVRTCRARAAAELLFVAAEERVVRADPVGDLTGALEGSVLQLGPIMRAREREDVDVRLADRSPGPQAIFDDRPAQLDP